VKALSIKKQPLISETESIPQLPNAIASNLDLIILKSDYNGQEII